MGADDLSTPPPGQLPAFSREELVARVKSMMAARILTGIPSSFAFDLVARRLYFLGIDGKDKSRRTSLFQVPLPDPSAPSGSEPAALFWQPVVSSLEESLEAAEKSHALTKEEQLLRERKRLSGAGLSSFVFEPNSGQLLIPAGGKLYAFSGRADPGVVREVGPVARPVTRADAKWSPDGSLVSYVRDGDIYVADAAAASLRELRLTHARDLSPTVSAGVAEFVMQEEFERFTGYWWFPRAVEVPGPGGEGPMVAWRIAYLEVDEAPVSLVRITRFGEGTEPPAVDEYRYPRAGEANARAQLCLVDLEADPALPLEQRRVVRRRLPCGLRERYPWGEYVVRCGWMPDGARVWLQLLDRRQQRLALVALDAADFLPDAGPGPPPPAPPDLDMPDASPPPPPPSPAYPRAGPSSAPVLSGFPHPAAGASPTPAAAAAGAKAPSPRPPEGPVAGLLREERSDVWINVSDVLAFLDDGSGRLLWGSEHTGFRHLYLLTPPCGPGDPAAQPGCRAVTSGSWQVDTEGVAVDAARQLVYFAGTRDSPLEKHLYCASFAPAASPAHVVRLTEAGMSHAAAVSPDCALFAAVSSSVSSRHTAAIYAIRHPPGPSASGQPAMPSAARLATLAPPARRTPSPAAAAGPAPLQPVTTPDIFSFSNRSGVVLHGACFKPPSFVEGVRYPTILQVYGGPHVQLVTNDWKLTAAARYQMLCSLGYLVVLIDGHGSARRGLHFEGALRLRLSQVELDDQVDGVQFLVSRGWADPARVVVTGWSYGGYLSLVAIARRPDVFRAALAGAAVTHWEGYDTAYTERYMDTPERNGEGYRAGSVLALAGQFPETERVMIVHGAMDENVHLAHTTALVSALVAAGRPYALQLYPRERHGLRDLAATLHFELASLAFWQRTLA